MNIDTFKVYFNVYDEKTNEKTTISTETFDCFMPLPAKDDAIELDGTIYVIEKRGFSYILTDDNKRKLDYVVYRIKVHG